jgi:hypothetical protein
MGRSRLTVLGADNELRPPRCYLPFKRALNPRFPPTIRLSLTTSQVQGGHLKSLKLFITQHNVALKRLASAVQLRPWPPHFKAVNFISYSSYYRQFTGSWCYCRSTTPSSSSGFLWLNRSSRNIPWASSLSSDIDLA